MGQNRLRTICQNRESFIMQVLFKAPDVPTQNHTLEHLFILSDGYYTQQSKINENFRLAAFRT